MTAYLLQINGLRLVGGLLLLFISYKLYKDNITGFTPKKNVTIETSNFYKAIITVIIADITMSLDNVLGVAGAAKDHYVLLIFGLTLSIFLMAFAAKFTANIIKKYKWINWIGLAAIVVVAMQLIYSDLTLFLA